MAMKPFLQRLAGEIASRYGDDPGQLCVVLPNRRAGLYLKKYLAAELKKTSWAPQTFSVEDFITRVSDLQIIDPAGLLFEFYHVYREIQGARAQDFDRFADWAQVLLKDFEEIDLYLADPAKIFNYLDTARALSVWNLDGTPLTEQEKNYLEFYNSFHPYYEGLRKNLTEKKQVYEGLAYRLVAENIEKIAADLPWKNIFFAGLNALSRSEENIIDFLVKKNKAELFWDADEYYINDTMQEAGDFIRGYLEKWPADPKKWLENEFRDSQKSIHVYGIPGGMGQAAMAGRLINELTIESHLPDKTALVLADEKMLLPVLYALPEKTGAVNVTMGYPFKYSHLYHLTGLLFRLQENAEKLSSQRNSTSRSFYVKDILELLAHPLLLQMENTREKGQSSFEEMARSIRGKNRVFLAPLEIIRYAASTENTYKRLCETLFTPWESPAAGLESLLQIIELLRDSLITADQRKNQHEIDLEHHFHLSRIIKRCRAMSEAYPFVTDLNILKKILFQVIDSSRLPFSGEPLQGLQVMGVLETRAIDFENLIVISMNEGILPAARLPNSFIPFDIKNDFGLPTFRHKDAVFAYHFYRMIQRARNIYLLYDTEGEGGKGGEKSRFITQAGYELPKYNPGIVIKEELLSPGTSSGSGSVISVSKSPAIIERLKEKAVKGFSPSSLNTFIRCPLQFYFQEVLGLAEAETVEETIEAKTMGTVIHQVLQNIYEPFEAGFVDPQALEDRLSKSEDYLKDAFRQHYPDGDLDFGKNHLVYKVSLLLINELIKKEIADLNESENPAGVLEIMTLEEPFNAVIDCEIASTKLQVRIKGKTDRIDRYGGQIRIIDYKTGNVNSYDLSVKEWDDLVKDPKKGKAFQLLVYAWLFSKINPEYFGSIQTGNITLRKISSGFMKVKLPGDQLINEDSMETFEEILVSLVGKIMDPSVPFTQTEDTAICDYCPFASICTR